MNPLRGILCKVLSVSVFTLMAVAVKLASDKDQAFTSPEFIAGALLYGLTAIGWVVHVICYAGRGYMLGAPRD